jgi:hypothetical protein
MSDLTLAHYRTKWGISIDCVEDIWNASRAALTEGMKPITGLFRTSSGNTIECFYHGTLLPADSRTLPQEAIDALPLGKTVPLYFADSDAAAVLAERERCAKIAEDRTTARHGFDKYGDAAAIRGQKP